MERNNSISSGFPDYLKNKPFREVFPWIGGDLQTLRDTFVIDLSKSKKNERASSSTVTTADYKQIEKILLKLNNKDLKKILDGHQPLNGTDDWMRGWISNTWERINSRRFPKNEMLLGLRTLADDIILKGRSSMKKDQLRESILALRASLRSRISSAMKIHDLTFE